MSLQIGSVPEDKVLPLIVEMLISLQSSVDVAAMMLCELQAEFEGKDQEQAAALYKEDYQERVQEQVLKNSFAFSERFPSTEEQVDGG